MGSALFNNITIGQYVPGNSVVHELDPRTKIVITGVLVIGLFLIDRIAGYIVMFAFVSGIVALSRIPASYILRGLRPLVLILLLTFGLHLFMNPGAPIFTLGPLVATVEGAYRGVLMVMRLILLIVVTSLMTLTTSPIALTDGLERLLMPASRIGVPAHELAMMMTIALRFIPTLLEETEKIMKAQMARGADFETGNIYRRARSMVPLLVPLFVSAFRRADELAMAMEARCYRGGQGRTRLRQLRLLPRDYLAGLIACGLVAAVGFYA